jgi:hypothetical protein
MVDMLNPCDHETPTSRRKAPSRSRSPWAELTRRAHRHRDARLTVVNDNHGDLTEAAPRMTERNMRTDLLPADHCLG